MTPDVSDLFATLQATWPPASWKYKSGWLLRNGAGGGKRVSAATPMGLNPDIQVLEDACAAEARRPLVLVRSQQTAVDRALAAAGYEIVDPTVIYLAPAADLAQPIRPVRAFQVDWPLLKIQREIWAEGGVGPQRMAVMGRAAPPKVSFLGRIDEQPAGTAFVAAHGATAMLHALEVRPPFRRRGVAQNLMRAAAHWALSQDRAWLALLVTEANTGANALYQGLGMQAVGGYHYRVKGDAP